jgi:hypothetical protein
MFGGERTLNLRSLDRNIKKAVLTNPISKYKPIVDDFHAIYDRSWKKAQELEPDDINAYAQISSSITRQNIINTPNSERLSIIEYMKYKFIKIMKETLINFKSNYRFLYETLNGFEEYEGRIVNIDATECTIDQSDGTINGFMIGVKDPKTSEIKYIDVRNIEGIYGLKTGGSYKRKTLRRKTQKRKTHRKH